MGINTLKGIGLALLGVILGVMIAIAEPANRIRRGPITDLLVEQIVAFRSYFWHVASAQVKISAINTSCTAAYLYIVLPLFGVDLHMKAALVGITFTVGLMPVVGNLVANTVLTVIGLDHSVMVAATSLLFAVVIHKLEYIWSGRIIGTKVDARVWELITSMLLLEHFLGVPGLVIAPIFYSWLKNEWRRWDKHVHQATPKLGQA
jgi:predicted PurR-regulated permease PerM